MKKIIRVAATVAVVTICAACGKGGGGSEGLAFETIKAEKSIGITNEQGTPQCSVNIQLAAAKGEPAERAAAINAAVVKCLLDMEETPMQQAVDSFANSYTRSYVRNFAPLYREDRNDPEKRAWYEYHYNITGEATTGREGVIVYTAVIDYYEGGAHGINQRFIMNFDSQTGKQLQLADVFVPGFESRLTERLLNVLMEKTDAKSIDELHEKGYLYSMDMFVPENFILDDDAVTFVFNPYEIAPYTEGIIELEIDNDELKDLWK